MKAIDLLEELIHGSKAHFKSDLVNLDAFPVWMSRTIQVYGIKLSREEHIYLVRPQKALPFDQLTNILLQIEKRLGGIVLLVADELNPKYRSLFVKNNIPFIYKDKSLFAPMLGIKLFDYKIPKAIKSKTIDLELTAFELKLLAGYLTGFIVREGFNLNQLEMILKNNQFQCSKSKLSQAINHLIKLNYVDVTGSGPNRLVTFKDRKEVWEELKSMSSKRFSKTVEGYYMIEGDFIFSGETALAHYSDLADSKVKHIAITNKELIEIERRGVPARDFGRPAYIFDVLKEPPHLFAKDDKYLNPVELYFLLRSHSDERVQMALEQMLKNVGLKI